jgi:hypothetical protein
MSLNLANIHKDQTCSRRKKFILFKSHRYSSVLGKKAFKLIRKKVKLAIHELNLIVTFKDLEKRINLETTQHQSVLYEKLHNKPVWIWNVDEHKFEDIKTNGDCCFNHIFGLLSHYGI